MILANATASSISAEIRRLGRVFNPEVLAATYELYEPLQRRAPKDNVRIAKDIGYGDHERQRLDIFVPSDNPKAAPIVVYVHGGGYVGGERSPRPGLIYDNVPTFFARNGMIGANMTYRLAPNHVWPSGALDVGLAVAWLRSHAGEFGGDPATIFLMGQSAGATHVATWTFLPHVHGATGPGISGAMLLSGVFSPTHPDYFPLPPQSHQIAYFGDDPKKWPQMSPLNFVTPGHPPVLVSVTEFDPPALQWHSPALVAELVKTDREMPWSCIAATTTTSRRPWK